MPQCLILLAEAAECLSVIIRQINEAGLLPLLKDPGSSWWEVS